MIALIDYGMGNIKSVENALNCVGADVRVTANAEIVSHADGIVIPGVGAFSEGITNLNRIGLIEVLEDQILTKRKPYLGICLGMQFLSEISLEGSETKGLNFIPGKVEKLSPDDEKRFKVPHMGWNDIETINNCPIFEGIDRPVFYFVHSYHFEANSEYVSGICWHGQNVVAAVWKDNIFGVQFHPEKSQGMGLKVLENFCTLIEGDLA